MRIGVDIDGTINLLPEVLWEYARYFNVMNGKRIPKRYKENYSLKEGFNWSEAQNLEFYRTYLKNAFKRTAPAKHAARGLATLRRRGAEIHLITSRLNIYKGITQEWLIINDIPYNYLHMNVKNKALKAKELNIDIFVEDCPKHVVELSKEGVKVLMPSWPYNINTPGGRAVVRNWAFITEVICNE
jgi:uncharacterized HAD superfamily protein